MKAADIDRMTTVYRRKVGKSDRGSRTVVLSTGTWVARRASHRKSETVGYEMLPPGNPPPSYVVSGRAAGWLCLTVDQFTEAGQALTDEQIIAHAESTLATVEAGNLPDLPAGLRLVLVPAREIVQTWADYEASIEQGRAAHAAAVARLAEQQAADEAAHQRILATLDPADLLPLSRRMDMQTTGAWTALEDLLTTYHRARTKQTATAGSTS